MARGLGGGGRAASGPGLQDPPQGAGRHEEGVRVLQGQHPSTGRRL